MILLTVAAFFAVGVALPAALADPLHLPVGNEKVKELLVLQL